VSDYDDLVAALSPVSAALTRLGIRHYVGGSVASSFHGAARSTMDVDLVADMTDSAVSEFLKCFDQDFYLSEAAIRDAIRRKSCFNQGQRALWGIQAKWAGAIGRVTLLTSPCDAKGLRLVGE